MTAVQATNRTMLWTMIRREMREHALAGVFSFIGLALMFLITSSLSHPSAFAGMSSADMSNIALTQVEMSSVPNPFGFFTIASVLVALFIGRAVSKGDREGDARAFLLHRPVDPTLIFAAKVIAASILFLLAAGLPVIGKAMWDSGAGHRPAPWDVRLMLPDVADLTVGLVYIASAMLMALRHRRFIDRGVLSLGVALAASFSVISASAFWSAELIALAALAVAIVAAWGTFRAIGGYETQPLVARATVAAAVALGVQAVFVVVIGVSGIFNLSRNMSGIRSTNTVLTSDGRLVQVTTALGGLRDPGERVVSVTDLAGHPLPEYADSTSRVRLSRGVVSTGPIALSPNTFRGWLEDNYRGTSRVYVPIMQPDASGVLAWYFVPDRGVLAAYDIRTWRQVGWMAPDGYHETLTLPSKRFEGALRPEQAFMTHGNVLAFPRDVYRADLKRREIARIFTAPPNEEITGANQSGSDIRPTFALRGRARDSVIAGFDAIATTRKVYVQTADGVLLDAIAHDSSVVGYGSVTVSRATLAPDTPTVLRYSPRNGALDARVARAAPTRAVVVTSGGVVRERLTIPRDTTAQTATGDASETVASAVLLTPVMRVISWAGVVMRGESRGPIDSAAMWLLTGLMALVAAIANAVMARRYAFAPRRTAVWTVIGLLGGVTGVVLMLALVTRPAREVCTVCGRMRVVTNERCEHCGSAFAAPAMDGTEILGGENVVASS